MSYFFLNQISDTVGVLLDWNIFLLQICLLKKNNAPSQYKDAIAV